MVARRSRTITLAALVMTMTLAACGSVRETKIKQGFPPAYADGYADGCSSGRAAAGGVFDETRKDTTRYGPDRQYTEGWDNAFEQCRSDMAATVRSDEHASGDHSKH